MCVCFHLIHLLLNFDDELRRSGLVPQALWRGAIGTVWSLTWQYLMWSLNAAPGRYVLWQNGQACLFVTPSGFQGGENVINRSHMRAKMLPRQAIKHQCLLVTPFQITQSPPTCSTWRTMLSSRWPDSRRQVVGGAPRKVPGCTVVVEMVQVADWGSWFS